MGVRGLRVFGFGFLGFGLGFRKPGSWSDLTPPASNPGPGQHFALGLRHSKCKIPRRVHFPKLSLQVGVPGMQIKWSGCKKKLFQTCTELALGVLYFESIIGSFLGGVGINAGLVKAPKQFRKIGDCFGKEQKTNQRNRKLNFRLPSKQVPELND